MGQLLTAYTINLLHQAGCQPTISDICRAVGLPKSTISRYIAWQISHDYVREVIDPHDRRIRRLQQTRKGYAEIAEMLVDLDEAFAHADEVINKIEDGTAADAEKILNRMEQLTRRYERRAP